MCSCRPDPSPAMKRQRRGRHQGDELQGHPGWHGARDRRATARLRRGAGLHRAGIRPGRRRGRARGAREGPHARQDRPSRQRRLRLSPSLTLAARAPAAPPPRPRPRSRRAAAERRFHCCQYSGTSTGVPPSRTSSPAASSASDWKPGSIPQPKPSLTAVAKSCEAGTKCRGGASAGRRAAAQPARLQIVAAIEVHEGCVAPSASRRAPVRHPARDDTSGVATAS